MTEINFQPIFDYIDKSSAETKAEITKLFERVDLLTAAVDTYLKQGEAYA